MKEMISIQSAGFTLCTSGNVQRIVAGRICTHSKGTLMLLSPAVPLVELSRSEDFAETTIVETIEHLSSIVMPHVSQLIDAGYMSHPFITVSDEVIDYFVLKADEINKKEVQYNNALPQHREIIEKILILKKEELLMEMLLVMLDQAPSLPQHPSRQELIASAFLLSLGREYVTHRNVAYYASNAGLSPRHFSLLVKEQTGRTPMEWIIFITISHAKRLLLKPDIQIKTVADALGFPEQFTFRKYFKKHTGLSPTEYRKRFAGGDL